jgi:hypothetical protein
MKKIIVLSVLLLFSISTSLLFAQKIKLVSGDLSFLKGQTKINIEYIYDGMMVGLKSEEDYVNSKVEYYNKDKAGEGDKWLQNWINCRKNKYQPKFEEMLNLYLKKNKVNFSPNNTDAKYTLILKTDFTEPGFSIGIARQPAHINTSIFFVETANKSNKLVEITIEDASSHYAAGEIYDAGFRIQEAYAACGKKLAKFLKKEAFK